MKLRSVPRLLVASIAAIGLGGTAMVLASGTASASSGPPMVSRIAPVSAPAGTSVSIAIHGHHFDTTAGGTTVTFGGVAALSVSCPTPNLCRAVTPNLPAGPASVVVTVDGVGALGTPTLTVNAYSAPVVRMLTNHKGDVVYSQSHVVDRYPATGGPGYDALTIQNTTSIDETLTEEANSEVVGTVTVDAGDSATVSLLADEGPYFFATSTSPVKYLNVTTKTPS